MAQPEVCWFGNIYSKYSMSPDPEKVQMIKNGLEPEYKTGVKSFLQNYNFVAPL